jgi:hypothetical protein
MVAGQDQQLEKAVGELLKQLSKPPV